MGEERKKKVKFYFCTQSVLLISSIDIYIYTDIENNVRI